MVFFVCPAIFDSLSAILALGDRQGQYCSHETNMEDHAQKAI